MADAPTAPYAAVLQQLARDPNPSREDLAGHLNQLGEQYIQTALALGKQAMAAARVLDEKCEYRALFEYRGSDRDDLPRLILDGCGSIDLGTGTDYTQKVTSNGPPTTRQIREKLRDSFFGRYGGGSTHPLLLRAELGIRTDHIHFGLNTKIWNHDFRTPIPFYEDCTYDEKTRNFRTIDGALVYFKPDGLPYNQEQTTTYEFSFRLGGESLHGQSYTLVPESKANDTEEIVKQLLIYELTGGAKLLPLGLIPLVMLKGMRDALDGRRNALEIPLGDISSELEAIARP